MGSAGFVINELKYFGIIKKNISFYTHFCGGLFQWQPACVHTQRTTRPVNCKLNPRKQLRLIIFRSRFFHFSDYLSVHLDPSL